MQGHISNIFTIDSSDMVGQAKCSLWESNIKQENI